MIVSLDDVCSNSSRDIQTSSSEVGNQAEATTNKHISYGTSIVSTHAAFEAS
jgi:hypothetical protein